MLRPASAALALSFVGLTVLTLHCGSDGDGSAFDDGTGNRDGGADSGGDFGPGFGGGNGDGTGNGGGGGGGDGGAEICDGIDNDGDGRIDNIDRGNDGICDCLLIATLGVKGGAGGSSDVFKNWLNGKSDIPAKDLGDAVLTPALLAQYQVIVAQDVMKNHAYSPAEVDALKAWVDKGGGFLTLTGYDAATEVVNVNRLLAPLGTKYNNVQILKQSGGSTVPVTMWTAGSPVTAGITSVGIDNGYEVLGIGPTPAPRLARAKEKLNANEYDVLRGQVIGSGHVLTWGDEWITFDGEWNGTGYQVERFWLNMIKWLTPATQCQVPIPPGIK